MTTLTTDEAREVVRQSLRRAVPGADLDDVADDEPIRSELELDSLDFLNFVEQLCSRAGVRIEEDDYPALDTVASTMAFLVERTAAG
jgi:acyl carrier protein